MDTKKHKLSPAAREARAAYHREWQRRNKEKCAISQAKYWARRAARMDSIESQEKEPEQNDKV